MDTIIIIIIIIIVIVIMIIIIGTIIIIIVIIIIISIIIIIVFAVSDAPTSTRLGYLVTLRFFCGLFERASRVELDGLDVSQLLNNTLYHITLCYNI